MGAVTSAGGWQQTVRLTIRRTRLTCRGTECSARRKTGLRGWAVARFTCLTYWTCFAGFSATWTAPPPTSAPPTARADNFARAIRTDISVALFSLRRAAPRKGQPLIGTYLCHKKRRDWLRRQWR